MRESCIPVEQLGVIDALPAGDPRREHLERCAHCGALAEMLREFAKPASRPAGAGFEELDARLLETIADVTGIPARAAVVAGAPEPRRELRERRETSPGRWFGIGGMRLAGAFGALVIVGAAGYLLWGRHPGEPQMRAEPPSSPEAATFTSESVTEVPGGVLFRWSPVANATAYRLVFLDESLNVIQRLDPVPGTSVQLANGAFPAGLAPGRLVGWEVEALAGGEILTVSPARSFRVP